MTQFAGGAAKSRAGVSFPALEFLLDESLRIRLLGQSWDFHRTLRRRRAPVSVRERQSTSQYGRKPFPSPFAWSGEQKLRFGVLLVRSARSFSSKLNQSGPSGRCRNGPDTAGRCRRTRRARQGQRMSAGLWPTFPLIGERLDYWMIALLRRSCIVTVNIPSNFFLWPSPVTY